VLVAGLLRLNDRKLFKLYPMNSKRSIWRWWERTDGVDILTREAGAAGFMSSALTFAG
tara:strand:- start:271 stop:444 length:174 start_codon:yes stop_codon:yes gene_type:complete